jgi:3-oxoacyl-[acyl-carrier-protein] synthase II
MRWALQDAALDPSEVDYVNAHGTSTPLNDPLETRVIKTVLGEHAYEIPISSTKSMIGHPMGAAGALEAIACAKTIDSGWIHPTINLEYPDPECDLDYVPNQARQAKVDVALSTHSAWEQRLSGAQALRILILSKTDRKHLWRFSAMIG